MTIEQSVELMIAISLLLVGLSYMFQPEHWIDWLHEIRRGGSRSSLSFGLINAAFGGFVVGFHFVWQGLPLLTTIIGVIAILKAATYLLYPSYLERKITMLMPKIQLWLKLSGLLIILLSAVIFYGLKAQGVFVL